MNGHISPDEFGAAPWALLNTSMARREALVAAVAERGWFVESFDEFDYDEGIPAEELAAYHTENAREAGLRFNGIHWED